MSDLTREEAHNLHTEMWNEIAENGYYTKQQTSFLQAYGHNLRNDCYLCEVYTFIDDSCWNCPFKHEYWKGRFVDEDIPCLYAKGSPYKKFSELVKCIGPKVSEQRRELAIEIAQLGIDHD